ncbi:hypothetical protein V3C99_009599 [Haemonchus contortus]|uniref:Secreted protein n=1 Tax=Haemonchus contortus TaxID=6289 RepID=A0A7I4YJZ0_HAECO|nr:unnamed protein product [Haemonchus contortus]
MNPVILLALLYLPYSVAYECVTAGELEYEKFGDYEDAHKELLKKALKKEFENGDLVVQYQVDRYDEELGATHISFPSVILSRSSKIKRPIYFVLQMSSTNVKRITPEEFIDTLYNCTLPSVPLVRLVE